MKTIIELNMTKDNLRKRAIKANYVLYFLSLIFLSCEFSAQEYDHFTNGHIVSSGLKTNNEMVGNWVFYNLRNDFVYGHGKYEDGRPNGKWIFYTGIDRAPIEYNFKNGIVDGLIVRYKPNGDTLDIIGCEGGVSIYIQTEDFMKESSRNYMYKGPCTCWELIQINDR